MKKSIVVVLFACAMGCSFASTLQAQELQEGTWSGSWTLEQGRSFPVTFEVKTVPDPHARWRPGKGDLLSITLVPQGRLGLRFGRDPLPLSDVRLEGEQLSFLVTALKFDCSLTLQQNGSYEGDCLGDGDNEIFSPNHFHLTMYPPAGSS